MIKIMGTPQASVEQMKVYIKKVNPQVSDSVTKMIPLYITEGTEEGVRGHIAFPSPVWKQETSRFRDQQ